MKLRVALRSALGLFTCSGCAGTLRCMKNRPAALLRPPLIDCGFKVVNAGGYGGPTKLRRTRPSSKLPSRGHKPRNQMPSLPQQPIEQRWRPNGQRRQKSLAKNANSLLPRVTKPAESEVTRQKYIVVAIGQRRYRPIQLATILECRCGIEAIARMLPVQRQYMLAVITA
jgi:hypothetical protein